MAHLMNRVVYTIKKSETKKLVLPPYFVFHEGTVAKGKESFRLAK